MSELRHFIPIAASPDQVYRALATQAGLRSWWTADTRADEHVGGRAEFGFDKRGTIFRMKIDALDAARRVVWQCDGGHPEWSGTTLTWEIAEADGKTTLRLAQTGLRSMSDFWASCNSTWGELMFRLKNYVEGKNPGPLWRE